MNIWNWEDFIVFIILGFLGGFWFGGCIFGPDADKYKAEHRYDAKEARR